MKDQKDHFLFVAYLALWHLLLIAMGVIGCCAHLSRLNT